MNRLHAVVFFFFFNDTATTEIYTLSLHDALPIYNGHLLWSGIVDKSKSKAVARHLLGPRLFSGWGVRTLAEGERSEEHTSELQSQSNLVCRLLLEKKK